MGQQNHHPEPCLISYGGVTCFPQSYNCHTILPPPGNRTAFDPRYLPENLGQVPYMFMLPSPSASVFSVPVNHDHMVFSNNHQFFERNRSLFMDGSNRVFKRSGSPVAVPMTSEVHNSSHFVQAVPTPWLDQHSGNGGFPWNHAHCVPYLQDIALHGYQVAAMSRNSLTFMHNPLMRPHQGPHDVYQPPPQPPMSPLQPQNMDIHLQLPSTSHRHSSSTSATYPVPSDANPRPRFVSPTMPHGIMVYEAGRQPLMIDLIARHYSFPHLRVLPVEHEQGEQFVNKDSRSSDDFSSDHVKTRIFTSSEPLPTDEEPNLCVICQMDFEDQEEIRVLNCRHEYHVECIKKWLTVKNNCPICKSTSLN